MANIRGGAIGLSILLAAFSFFAGADRAWGEGTTENESEFARLAGFVYIDINNSRTYNDFERFIASVKIVLEGTDLEGGSILKTTTTAKDGSYFFEGLPAGTYAITETSPERYVEGRANEPGSAGGQAPDGNHFVNIVLDQGEQATDYNFGEWGLKAKYVSKRYYLSNVPEPSTLLLLLTGLAAFLAARRRVS